jgi:hypothetical protein
MFTTCNRKLTTREFERKAKHELGRVNVRAEKLGVGSKELGKLSGNGSTLTQGKGNTRSFKGTKGDSPSSPLLRSISLLLIIIPSHLSCKCNKG